MIGLLLIIGAFNASATSSIAMPVTFSWEASEGVTASLSIECDNKKIGFWHSPSAKIFKCGEKIDTMPIVHHIDLRPQDLEIKTTVLFTLNIQKDYRNIPEQKSLTIDFYPHGFEEEKIGAMFTRDLFYGMQNDPEIRELQGFLKSLKIYNGPITGNFYGLTLKGVKSFQRKYKINPTGFVGPLTRRKLNELV